MGIGEVDGDVKIDYEGMQKSAEKYQCLEFFDQNGVYFNFNDENYQNRKFPVHPFSSFISDKKTETLIPSHSERQTMLKEYNQGISFENFSNRMNNLYDSTFEQFVQSNFDPIQEDDSHNDNQSQHAPPNEPRLKLKEFSSCTQPLPVGKSMRGLKKPTLEAMYYHDDKNFFLYPDNKFQKIDFFPQNDQIKNEKIISNPIITPDSLTLNTILRQSMISNVLHHHDVLYRQDHLATPFLSEPFFGSIGSNKTTYNSVNISFTNSLSDKLNIPQLPKMKPTIMLDEEKLAKLSKITQISVPARGFSYKNDSWIPNLPEIITKIDKNNIHMGLPMLYLHPVGNKNYRPNPTDSIWPTSHAAPFKFSQNHEYLLYSTPVQGGSGSNGHFPKRLTPFQDSIFHTINNALDSSYRFDDNILRSLTGSRDMVKTLPKGAADFTRLRLLPPKKISYMPLLLSFPLIYSTVIRIDISRDVEDYLINHTVHLKKFNKIFQNERQCAPRNKTWCPPSCQRARFEYYHTDKNDSNKDYICNHPSEVLIDPNDSKNSNFHCDSCWKLIKSLLLSQGSEDVPLYNCNSGETVYGDFKQKTDYNCKNYLIQYNQNDIPEGGFESTPKFPQYLKPKSKLPSDDPRIEGKWRELQHLWEKGFNPLAEASTLLPDDINADFEIAHIDRGTDKDAYNCDLNRFDDQQTSNTTCISNNIKPLVNFTFYGNSNVLYLPWVRLLNFQFANNIVIHTSSTLAKLFQYFKSILSQFIDTYLIPLQIGIDKYQKHLSGVLDLLESDMVENNQENKQEMLSTFYEQNKTISTSILAVQSNLSRFIRGTDLLICNFNGFNARNGNYNNVVGSNQTNSIQFENDNNADKISTSLPHQISLQISPPAPQNIYHSLYNTSNTICTIPTGSGKPIILPLNDLKSLKNGKNGSNVSNFDQLVAKKITFTEISFLRFIDIDISYLSLYFRWLQQSFELIVNLFYTTNLMIEGFVQRTDGYNNVSDGSNTKKPPPPIPYDRNTSIMTGPSFFNYNIDFIDHDTNPEKILNKLTNGFEQQYFGKNENSVDKNEEENCAIAKPVVVSMDKSKLTRYEIIDMLFRLGVLEQFSALKMKAQTSPMEFTHQLPLLSIPSIAKLWSFFTPVLDPLMGPYSQMLTNREFGILELKVVKKNLQSLQHSKPTLPQNNTNSKPAPYQSKPQYNSSKPAPVNTTTKVPAAVVKPPPPPPPPEPLWAQTYKPQHGVNLMWSMRRIGHEVAEMNALRQIGMFRAQLQCSHFEKRVKIGDDGMGNDDFNIVNPEMICSLPVLLPIVDELPLQIINLDKE
jgi:hypothetical protein